MMFQAILTTQWKSSRVAVLLATLIAFALPLASLQAARDAFNAIQFINAMQQWALGYSLLAAGLGLLLAMNAWQPDHAGRHVYALTLPVTRARYAILRMTAGAMFLVPPVVGLLAGAMVVATSEAIPHGLHAYPVGLAIRFLLAAMVAYAVFFAIAASTSQTAGVILGLIAAVLFTQYLLSVTGSELDILGPIVEFVFMRPGLLSIFAGRWMLVDV